MGVYVNSMQHKLHNYRYEKEKNDDMPDAKQAPQASLINTLNHKSS